MVNYTEHNQKVVNLIIQYNRYNEDVNFTFNENGKIDIVKTTYCPIFETYYSILVMFFTMQPKNYKILIDIIELTLQDYDINELIIDNDSLFRIMLCDFCYLHEHRDQGIVLIKDIVLNFNEHIEQVCDVELKIMLYMIDNGYQIKESDFEPVSLMRPGLLIFYNMEPLKEFLTEYSTEINHQYVLK